MKRLLRLRKNHIIQEIPDLKLPWIAVKILKRVIRSLDRLANTADRREIFFAGSFESELFMNPGREASVSRTRGKVQQRKNEEQHWADSLN